MKYYDSMVLGYYMVLCYYHIVEFQRFEVSIMSCMISISSCFDYDIPLEEQMKYVSEAGFTHISLGSDLEHSKLFENGRIEQIKSALNKNKLSVDTIHFSQSLSSDNWQPIMEKTMQIAKKLDCFVIVAHCTSFMGEEIQNDEDIERLKLSVIDLISLCKKYNVKVALENLCPGKATDILEQMLETADSNYIGFCYDSSHDQINGPRPMILLEKWKHRLMAIHISDRIKPFTDHVTIGEGFICFDEMIEILRNISLDFPFLMEVVKTYSQYKDTKKFLKTAYTGAHDVVSKLNRL